MIDWVAGAHDRWVSRQLTRDINVIWGYEDFAASSFARAKALAIRTIYDLPTIHHLDAQVIHQREVDNDPSLSPFLSPSLEPEHRLLRKLAELDLADVVVCASSFVRSSLIRRGLPASKLRLLPYGVTAPSRRQAAKRQPGPLRLLYAGLIGPHKGIHHLFEALRELPRGAVQLSLAGHWVPGFRNWIERRFNVPFRDAGRLTAAALASEYRKADVLVFPALRDGFGLVLVEAMAQGLPVIASTSCAAPDLIRDGVEGLLVPPSNPFRLRAAIQTLLDQPQLAPAMADAAFRLSLKLTWENYHSQILALSQQLVEAEPVSA